MSIDSIRSLLFSGLKNDVWRQYIDLEFQHLGKYVFDTGTHEGEKEPGFLKSILDAHTFALSLLGEKLDYQLYDELHYKAMQHAEKYEKEHRFRLNQSFCPFPRMYFEEGFVDGIDVEVTPKILPYDDEDDKKQLAKRTKEAGEKVDAKKMNAMYFRFSFSYGRGEREKIGLKINQLFDTLEEDIKEINNSQKDYEIIRKEKLYRICRFLKEIEFLHPYIDGNTRVNYVVLNKVLVENGFTPILPSDNVMPYTKKLSTILTWLEQGLMRWQAAEKAVSNNEDIEKALIDFDEKYKDILITTRKHFYKPLESNSEASEKAL